MPTVAAPYRNQLLEELDRIPKEYLPTVLKIVQAFREGIALPPTEANSGEILPEPARDRLLSRMRAGISLGGPPYPKREEIYERSRKA
jgi:hypothetical protein